MHPLRQILSNWEWYNQNHGLRSQSTYEKLRICTGKKLKKTQNNIILYLTTAFTELAGRQENLFYFPPLPPSFNALNSSLCSIFLICSCSFCLKNCWLDQSQGFAHGMPGGTQLLKDWQDKAHAQEKQVVFSRILVQAATCHLLHEIRSYLKCC